ncbi:hypothetical protein [Wocania ichthyoenteri]|uniref:hypothetical protein n=1 Tax=Wocania ichthyoenteri TaxID=1230531 RepID=UPI00053EE852|nr:hypothetical protein [Wocania ichthyoenteri]
MKLIKKLILPIFALSLVALVYSNNIEQNKEITNNHYAFSSSSSSTYSLGFTWQGTGPYGQVDVTPSGGTAPYKWYKGNTLLQTTYSSTTTTLSFGCNGGVLMVKDANNDSSSDIVPQGCVDHGGGQGN